MVGHGGVSTRFIVWRLMLMGFLPSSMRFQHQTCSAALSGLRGNFHGTLSLHFKTQAVCSL